MKNVCVEGWRKINHSYAMVNQWQLLEMVKSPIHVRHKDVPYFRSNWNAESSASGFSNIQSEIIDAISEPSPRESFDITYRIAYPYNIGPASSRKLFVFGTAEYQSTDGKFINGDLQSANKNDGLTIITPSQWSKTGFLRAGFESDKVLVIPHGVDPGTFYPIEEEKRRRFRDALKLKATDFVLLSVGAMTDNKGIALLIVAFAALKKQYSNLKLILKDQRNLYGRGAHNYLSEIKNNTQYGHLLTDNAVSDIVFVSQNLDLKQLHGLYGASDCYVSPYKAEGFNLTPLEAAACGVPILVTKGGATDDYFDSVMGSQIEGKLNSSGNKFFLEPDIDSLIFELTRIIDGKVACGGAQGGKHVHEYFSWGKISNQLLSALGV